MAILLLPDDFLEALPEGLIGRPAAQQRLQVVSRLDENVPLLTQ